MTTMKNLRIRLNVMAFVESLANFQERIRLGHMLWTGNTFCNAKRLVALLVKYGR